MKNAIKNIVQVCAITINMYTSATILSAICQCFYKKSGSRHTQLYVTKTIQMKTFDRYIILVQINYLICLYQFAQAGIPLTDVTKEFGDPHF